MPSLRLSKLIRTNPDRPTLKQRAAALKAKAGRVLHKSNAQPSPSPVVYLPPIADLLAQSLMRAWAADAASRSDGTPEGNAASDRSLARVNTIAKAIERLPATRANLAAKALALAYIMESDLLDDTKARDDYATDGRLAFDMHAVVTGSPPAETEPHEFAGLIEPHVVGAGLDVAGLSMQVLENLHDAAGQINGIGNAMLCQPCFEAAREGITVSHNAAGQFLDWITEVSSLLIERARMEACQRKPKTETDRELRLGILARATVQNGDPAEMHALARDLKVHARRLARG